MISAGEFQRVLQAVEDAGAATLPPDGRIFWLVPTCWSEFDMLRLQQTIERRYDVALVEVSMTHLQDAFVVEMLRYDTIEDIFD